MTNPICWTCKNCSYECAADCEQCVTQPSNHGAVLIIFPLNLQTITITRMLSNKGEGWTVLKKLMLIKCISSARNPICSFCPEQCFTTVASLIMAYYSMISRHITNLEPQNSGRSSYRNAPQSCCDILSLIQTNN